MRRLKSTFPKTYSVARLVFNSDSYIYKSGWIESLRQGYPCDQNGNPLPWMNYSLINFLKERLTDKMRVFEFGCGYSTMFYADKVQSVLSLEHEKKWFEIVSRKLPENAKVVLSNNENFAGYADFINTVDDKFDVIIVDGVDRVNCFRNSIDNLNETGVLILDDSSRGNYTDAIEYAFQNGFKSLTFSGIKPTGIGIDESMLFYRSENCLGV